MAQIKFDSVTFRYGGHTIFEDFSLTVDESQILGVVGPSGCGKTTLIRCLCGFIKPEKGEIYIGDTCVFSAKKRINVAPEKRNIGVVFQDYAVWPHMTVWENVVYPMKKKKMPKDEIQKKAEFALSQVRMEKYKNHLPSQLSGGQQQRVAIARSLVSSDDVIVLDEPITNLDAKLRVEMRTTIKELQNKIGITTVYVTHDQEEAMAVSDRIAVMNKGYIQHIGRPKDLYQRPANLFVATFIGESNILPGKMIEDYLVEFNGKRFEAVDGGMRPNESVEVVIRPEDLRITLPEEGKLQVKVDTQLFRGVHYEIIAYDELGNEWMIHSTRKAIVGEEIGLDFEPEDIHIMRLNETEEEFDARIEEYVEIEEQEAGLINAIEEERDEENNL